MIEVRPFAELGGDDHDWLDTKHHFSFASYSDRNRMHWGQLRVWNDDTIQPQTGFPLHPHQDMEIITYVREGAITHGDSLGNKGRTIAGDIQVMSAGTGIATASTTASLRSPRFSRSGSSLKRPACLLRGEPGHFLVVSCRVSLSRWPVGYRGTSMRSRFGRRPGYLRLRCPRASRRTT